MSKNKESRDAINKKIRSLNKNNDLIGFPIDVANNKVVVDIEENFFEVKVDEEIFDTQEYSKLRFFFLGETEGVLLKILNFGVSKNIAKLLAFFGEKRILERGFDQRKDKNKIILKEISRNTFLSDKIKNKDEQLLKKCKKILVKYGGF